MVFRTSTIYFSRFLLVILLGMMTSLTYIASEGVSLQAQADSNRTLTITDCSGETGPGRIATVISASSSGDTIRFSCSGSIPFSTTLVIDKSLTLDGKGQKVTLDGGKSVPVMSVKSGINFNLDALTIADGFTNSTHEGAGLFNDGGTVSIRNSIFTGNTDLYGDGGGISNQGTMSITNSTITNNTAGVTGGGLVSIGTISVSNSAFTHNTAAGFGGGFYNYGTANITRSVFSANVSKSDGGGLFNDSGTLNISYSIFSANAVPTGDYGGLYNRGTSNITNSTFANNSAYNAGGLGNNGTEYITDSTINNNTASRAGGGFFNTGTVNITNSTIADNSANFEGGGLYNLSSLAQVSITSSTFAGNLAPDGSGGGIENYGTVSIGGSIIANNPGGNCASSTPIGDQGYNLESSTDCGFTGTGDLQNSKPKFDSTGLQQNGGPTMTMALQPDSPAVDHILPGTLCPATDQRGVRRPQGSRCDIGAFEMRVTDGLRVMLRLVNSFDLNKYIQARLDRKLYDALAAVKRGKLKVARASLDHFITEVHHLTGHGITKLQAAELFNDASAIKTRLVCSPADCP
jgi:hypothetical protein